MKNLRSIIALFFITLMLLFKVAGLHALTHYMDESDAQHCEVCHISSAVNFTPLLKEEPLVLPQTEFYFCEQKLTVHDQEVVFKNRFWASSLFTRPPPRS